MSNKITSYGVMPVRTDEAGQPLYLLVESLEGYWGFPKGHPKPGESIQETAIREAKEEAGLQISAEDLKTAVSYGYQERGGGNKFKTVILYPVIVDANDISVQATELKSYRWVTADKAVDLINVPGAEEMMRQAGDLL